MSETEAPKILVIDDDEMALVIIRKLLEAENCAVEVSSSPREALGKLPEKRYDAIFCDMWMAGMNGKEFYQQVKKDFPEYQRRIIFVTGDLASEATWGFIDERHLPYLLKPFSRPELRRRLREVVGERPAAAPAPVVERPPEAGANKRRHRRIAMKANVRVRRKKWAVGGPDIRAVVNASKEGVYFLTDGQYRVGTEVLVAFPYVGYNDVEQEGYVVRVDERPDGLRGVALALGEAAQSARVNYAGSEEDARRHYILSMADLSAPTLPPGVGETKSSAVIASEREEARLLAEELTQLKITHDRVLDQRDHLAKEEAELNQKLAELTAAKAAMTQLVDDLNSQMDLMQKELASTEEFRFQATHDALTGLWNRGAILDILKRELLRAQREGTPVGVVLADLDHFKSVNDTYGHLAGDAVLRESAQRINAAVRAYDAVGRYGGEEFLIVLPGCDAANSFNQAERIRALVSAETVATAEGAIPITLSLGVASSGELQETEAILRAADAALYGAKRAGRNRVEAASAVSQTSEN